MRLRGRKGIREEIEQQPEMIILDPFIHFGKWAEVFGNDQPIHLELGMGKGKFISETSLKHQQINHIGIDLYDELVRKACEKAKKIHQLSETEHKIHNLKLVRMNIEHIDRAFSENEVERIYLNFSDPWPKKKHISRRLTHPKFLEKYANILKNQSEIHFKTDSIALFEYSLNSFSDFGMQLKHITFDLHANVYEQEHILTEYESKFISQGLKIHRFEAIIKK
jgi:tRNA (guanine-N7-)-methyltransferase